MRDVLLVEVLARVIKNQLRKRFREKMKLIQHLSESSFRECAVEFINLVFFCHRRSNEHWKQNVDPDCRYAVVAKCQYSPRIKPICIYIFSQTILSDVPRRFFYR